MSLIPFGHLADGTQIDQVTLSGGGLTAKVLTWGAVLQDLRLASHAEPLVLGLASLEHYTNHSPHMGAMAGRFANRIGGGVFKIAGTQYQLDLNEQDITHLHGGAAGFGQRPWRLLDHGSDFVTLALFSDANESGYPGAVNAQVTYRLQDGGVFAIEASAETTAPTLVNLAHHSYFNLDGGPDCRNHLIEIDADAFTPLDANSVPTGEVDPVQGTPYDLRTLTSIGSGAITYDINYCLAAMPRRIPDFAAMVVSPKSGVTMEMWTTEPGVQFYDASKMRMSVPGLDGKTYGPHAGFCLEAQRWPDAPNHRHFPSATLLPGEIYRQVTEYRFSKAGGGAG